VKQARASILRSGSFGSEVARVLRFTYAEHGGNISVRDSERAWNGKRRASRSMLQGVLNPKPKPKPKEAKSENEPHLTNSSVEQPSSIRFAFFRVRLRLRISAWRHLLSLNIAF